MTAKMERWAYFIGTLTLLAFLFVFASHGPFFTRIDPDLSGNSPLRAFYFTIFPLLALTALSSYFNKVEIFWPSFSALVSILTYMILIVCINEMKNFPTLWFPGVMLIYFLAAVVIVIFAFNLSGDHELLRWAEKDKRNEARKRMRFIAFAEYVSILIPISFVTILFHLSTS